MADFFSSAAVQVVELPLSFHKGENAGNVWDRVFKAGQAISIITEQVIIRLAPEFLSVIIGIGIAFYINVYLALILLAGMGIYVGTLIKILPPIVDLNRKGQKAWGDAYSRVYEAIANYQTIKNSTSEDYERKRIRNGYLKKVVPLWTKVEFIWASISFYQRVTVLGTQLLIFLVAVALLQNGSLTLGGLIALNSYAAMVFGPFVQLGYSWQTVQNGLVNIERAEVILSKAGEFEHEKSKIVPTEIEGNISFENVRFRYDRKSNIVIDDVSFVVAKGQVVALVGESGVGKSTTVDLLSSGYFPTSGTIRIDGIDSRKISLRALRRRIAVVPQEVTLFNDSILNNIRYGNPSISKDDVYAAARLAHADTFIGKFPKKYNQLVGERGVKLSVGQKQRIAIARAILRDPAILILDEPTSALDLRTEKLISESLEALMKNRTTFIIAHRLSTVRKANLILVFNKGKIIERGTHEELVAMGGEYSRMNDLHIGLN
ncbi:MAG: ABC transporter ATP-binding protein [bacterium]|nr:ABC transporter ATP-binding protein [bacterium]